MPFPRIPAFFFFPRLAAMGPLRCRPCLFIATPFFLYLLLLPSFTRAQGGDEKDVVAIGLGVSEDAARREAYRNAVQSVIGAMVVAETIVENDALVRDKVLSHSDGYVSKAAQVGPARPAGDGLIEVTMRVTVKSGRLQQKLRDERISVSALDGAVLFEKALRHMEERERVSRGLAAMLETLPASLVYAEADVSQGRRSFAEKGLRLTLPIHIFVNPQAYGQLAGQLRNRLEEMGCKKTQVNLSLSKEGGIYTQGLLKKLGGPQKDAAVGELFWFGVCEVIQADTHVSRWSFYAVPKHVLEALKRSTRMAVDVVLLDQAGGTVAAGEIFLGDKEYANILQPVARLDGASLALMAPRFNLYNKSLSLQAALNISPQSKDAAFLLTEEEFRRVAGVRCVVRNRD